MAVETEMDEPIIPTFDDTDAMTAEEEPAQTDADSDKRSYMRFGRSYMRFGRSAVSARCALFTAWRFLILSQGLSLFPPCHFDVN